MAETKPTSTEPIPPVPPWKDPPDEPGFKTVQVIAGEFAGRPMRFTDDVAAQAIADGWAKKFGDPDPEHDEEKRAKALEASHKALTEARTPKAEHHTRDMQAEKPDEGYKTKATGKR